MSGSAPKDEGGAPAAIEAAAPVSTAEFTPHTATPSLMEGLQAPGDVPVVETPAATPAAEAPVEAAAAPEEKPAEAAAEAKPAEAAAAADDKPAEAAPVELEPITYPEWKLPEGVAPDKGKLGQFTEVLAQHRVSPEVGQALLDQHTAAMQSFVNEYAEKYNADAHRIFGETRANWANQVKADPEVGGARFDTAMGVVARVRDAAVSGAKPGSAQYDADVKAFNEFLAVTGAGDHPAFIKFVHRMGKYMDEPGLPPANAGAPKNGGMAPRRLKDTYKSNEARNGQ